MRLRSTLHNTAPPSHTVNVTPMIDVIMCLIIFYLIVGKLAADQLVNVRLPQAHHGLEPTGDRSLIISVLPAINLDGSGGVRVLAEGREIRPDELTPLIRAHRLEDAEAWVRVRADRSLEFAQVLPVIRACREVGLANVQLSVEPAS
jgi:biopolymer transport protein ExbD